MHILQVTPGPVYPPSRGGQHRMHGLLTGRKKKDKIDRFVHALIQIDDAGKVTIDENYSEHRSRSLLQYSASFVTSRILGAPPIFASEAMNLVITNKLKRMVAESDAVIVEYPWEFKHVYKQVGEGVPVIYSSHNFEVERFDHLRDGRRYLLHDRIRRIEEYAVRNADLTVVTSERDKSSYEQLVDEPGEFHVAPNGAYLNDIRYANSNETSQTSGEPYVIIFVGSPHPANITAVENIIEVADNEEIGKRNIEFIVAGKVSKAFDEVPENVRLLGFVDDLDDLYATADLAINPMTDGGGTNVKMIEYFAAGVPVLSSPFGARGIPAEAGEHYLEAEVEEMPDTITMLYDENDRNQDIINSEIRIVEEKLNWKSISSRFLDEVQKLR